MSGLLHMLQLSHRLKHVQRSRKCSLSQATSPITDKDIECVTHVVAAIPSADSVLSPFRMLASPAKSIATVQRVRFDRSTRSVMPLKGVLKKPEVVIPACVVLCI
jgi:hypothetical protein